MARHNYYSAWFSHKISCCSKLALLESRRVNHIVTPLSTVCAVDMD